MDRPRADQYRRRRQRWISVGAAVLAVIGVAVAVARLEPAPPTVDRSLVWIDTVKRGSMLRQVRGIGSLVPEDITWIAARTQGRVERIVLRPGALVKAGHVILVLTNPQVVQAAADADSQLKAAEAEVVNLKAQLESGLLAAESAAATAWADYEQSRLRAEVNERLFKNGLVSELDLRLSRVTVEQAKTRNEIEQKRFAFARTSIAPQLSVKRAEMERLRAQARLRHEELDSLEVRAGMKGVLQLVPVEVGAQVGPGTNLERLGYLKRDTGEGWDPRFTRPAEEGRRGSRGEWIRRCGSMRAPAGVLGISSCHHACREVRERETAGGQGHGRSPCKSLIT